MKTLKDLYSVIKNDIKGEGFTKRERVIYGILAPLALVAACVLAELLKNQ